MKIVLLLQNPYITGENQGLLPSIDTSPCMAYIHPILTKDFDLSSPLLILQKSQPLL